MLLSQWNCLLISNFMRIWLAKSVCFLSFTYVQPFSFIHIYFCIFSARAIPWYFLPEPPWDVSCILCVVMVIGKNKSPVGLLLTIYYIIRLVRWLTIPEIIWVSSHRYSPKDCPATHTFDRVDQVFLPSFLLLIASLYWGCVEYSRNNIIQNC